MNSTFVTALVRHILTTLGGVLVANGYADGGTVETIAGGGAALVGVLWSLYEKIKRKGPASPKPQ